VTLASNSVSVQFNWVRAGAGVAIVHAFALPFAPDLVRILPDRVGLTRAFWLIRHADDGRVERLNRLAALLAQGLRREVARLEARAANPVLDRPPPGADPSAEGGTDHAGTTDTAIQVG
jgi:DNA-binding transcriptional LysR family regulator